MKSQDVSAYGLSALLNSDLPDHSSCKSMCDRRFVLVSKPHNLPHTVEMELRRHNLAMTGINPC